MKILIAAPDPWNAPIPYHIAPQRVARALTRAGHAVYNLDIHGDPYKTAGLSPIKPDTIHQKPWGTSIHSSYHEYIDNLRNALDDFEPDLMYMFGSLKFNYEMHLFSERKLPVGFHQADPYWIRFPSKNDIKQYNMMDFMTFNEGQAWNYVRQHGLGDKARLLLHAIDPELAPTIEDVKNTNKKYLCSTVMGGEGILRIPDRVEKYYAATNSFPDQLFIVGGGLWKGLKWMLDKDGNKIPYEPSRPFAEDETRLHNQFFNVAKIFENDCRVFPEKENPAVLCHKFIHRLYLRSFYGFTPWGDYLRVGHLAEYNTMTFGTKTTEMGGSGAAMLSCRINDIEQLVIDGKTGFIVDGPKDTESAFQYAIDNPAEVKKMGEEAYKDIHKRHSWDVRYREVLAPTFRELGVL